MASTTRGQLEVIGNEPRALLLSLNDCLRRIRDELDELHGLRAAASFYGQKTLVGVPLRLVDANGTLIHAWGTTT